MRVTLVVERFDSGTGGVENVVRNVAHGLVQAGDEVRVLARLGLPMHGVALEIVDVPSFWQPIRVTSFARRTREILEGSRRNSGIVHAFSRTTSQDVFHAGGGSHLDYMQRTYGRAGAALRRASPRHATLLALERRIFTDPHLKVQCVSSMVRDELKRRFGLPDARLSVIPCGVDPALFSPERNEAHRKPLRETIGAGDAAVWLLVGSGWRRKGLDTAIEALAASRDGRRQLWIAGRDAPERWRRHAERHGVADRVRFVGERRDVPQLLAAADGLILPSRYDAFGLVCLEACASGRPVICSDRTGASELLGAAGIVVPDPSDAAAFARAMDHFDDAGRREDAGRAGLDVAQRHSWSRQTARLRELYATVAA